MIFSAVLCLPVVPPPGKIKVLTVEPTSVVLSWGSPQGLVGSKSFRVEWSGGLEKVNGCLVIENVHTVEIDNLQFGQQYLFSVATADKDGNLSEKVTATVFTGKIRDVKTLHISFTAVSLYFFFI